MPHHGSRRNVSTEILDFWLGQKLPTQPMPGERNFFAMLSASDEDEGHPKKAVIRAMIHRGGEVITCEKDNLYYYYNSPDRGWGATIPLPYPEDQEE